MGKETAIEWTDHTFNPWIGCTKVSAACDNCYAETLVHRYGWAEWGSGKPRHRTSTSNWAQPLKWNRDAIKAGIRRRVFCASLADVFDAEVSDQWRWDLIDLILRTPMLDWQLLTKRPQVAKKFFTDRKVPDNVWLGTTVEDQKMAELRIPILLSIDAKVRFLSCEPLQAPLDLDKVYLDLPHAQWVDWIIIGGESGPGARPMKPEWARQIRDQMTAAGVKLFFKQWGDWAPYDRGRTDSATLAERAALDYPMQRFGKKLAGALLDGRTWKEFPRSAA